MIRLILRAAEWLDRRFPPKVVVTQENYDDLKDRVNRQKKDLERIAGENLLERARIDLLEKSLSALKDGITKGQVPMASSEKSRLRDEFVKGEGEAWAGRPQSPVVPAGA